MTTKMGVLARGTSNVGVLEALRAAILSGEIKPGTQLKQSDIAGRLGVSQGPVREALGRLVEEGLVELIPYRGMFVSMLTQRDVDEIYQVRTAIEVFAFELGFEKLRALENDQTLQKLYENAIERAKTLDTESAVSADLSFHRFLVEVSDNSRLIKFWDSLLAQSRNILTKLYTLDHGAHIMDLVSDHEKMIHSVRNGDRAEGVRLIKEHLENARATLMKNWEEISEE